MRRNDWVKLPTNWIQKDGGLKRLGWNSTRRSDNIAALMVLIALAHHADQDNGIAKITYDDLIRITDLCRAKVSAGLNVLDELGVVGRDPQGRSTYKLVGFDDNRWGKLPQKRLYSHNCITFFSEFHLRTRSELDALKLYLLFIAFRNNTSNMAHISYDKIEEHTGIYRGEIKKGLNILAANGLVHVEHVPSAASDYGIANAYRVAYIDPFNHLGTRGRGMEAVDFESPFSPQGGLET
jgi:hypothetical protein